MGEDRTRFPAPGALLAEAGLAPVTRASGRTRQVRFRYAANHRENDWSRQAFDNARARGHGKYRALRGLGARWTRILWRCWTDHAPYDPAIHHHNPELTAAT